MPKATASTTTTIAPAPIVEKKYETVFKRWLNTGNDIYKADDEVAA